jgi:hypothetical protein
MALLPRLGILSLAGLLAGTAPAAEPTVKISLSAQDPDEGLATHATTDVLEFWVFVDDVPNRGGEFGLVLEGGTCLGFIPDPDEPWIVLPMVRPYPGTIAQARAGDDCPDPPVCFGKLLVKPATAGGRVIVDVIPSERAQEVTLLNCDYSATNWFTAFPAVVNGNGSTDPVPHLVSRPSDPLQLVPEESDPRQHPEDSPGPAASDARETPGHEGHGH